MEVIGEKGGLEWVVEVAIGALIGYSSLSWGFLCRITFSLTSVAKQIVFINLSWAFNCTKFTVFVDSVTFVDYYSYVSFSMFGM